MYDGAAFHGWQVQQNAVTVQKTVQDALEQALGFRPDVSGCSRTDAGVHAKMYVCHITADGVNIPLPNLARAVNSHFPDGIAVTDAAFRPADFHARYSCTGKEYVYRVWNAPYRNPFLDAYSMFVPWKIPDGSLGFVGEEFRGRHDFRAFMANGSKITDDTVRTVEYFTVKREGELLTIAVKADGFLYNMVRIMVGTYLDAAKGKLKQGDVAAILEKGDRTLAGDTAPAKGLCLNRVFYE